MDYLVFRLYGPMASWGDIAVGESRHSHSGPTKAAVLGLVAAALGIRREEEATHLALNQRYALATAVRSKGQLLRDYHTVQAPDSVGKFRYRTRRDELVAGRERLGTVLSSREYRTDALAWVALRVSQHGERDGVPFTLADIAEALQQPRFSLYLGRKSCPLAAPLQPQLLQADGFYGAFAQYQPKPLQFERDEQQPLQAADDTPQLAAESTVEYNWEGELDDFRGEQAIDASALMTFTQHDQLLSRQRWQFAPRKVLRLYLTEGH
ncbi:CRISPR-associated protein Cas5 [Pokkaliibacter plantistimulans]|uniref:CRISPR-associated protein Cas5 n=1 Tax=Pokkaliibacter plantistimulans TaxID=1635171 RepID=A0ABX5LX86_9GAMM|nr:type I-E CRISPR-associated protein Cas5/CasD [Pokkaliibacter plantistimulans]PXF30797.1 CRISPR-associated protein Cas5 [Pokkaliibacter plantistimulans]